MPKFVKLSRSGRGEKSVTVNLDRVVTISPRYAASAPNGKVIGSTLELDNGDVLEVKETPKAIRSK